MLLGCSLILVSVSDCKAFKEKFTEAAESQQTSKENKDASAAAGLLEKLSVEDKKTEAEVKEDVSTATEKKTESEPGKAVAEKKEEVPAATEKETTESEPGKIYAEKIDEKPAPST